MPRFARLSMFWPVAGGTVETPLQKLPFRVMAVTWGVTFVTDQSYGLMELIDGSGVTLAVFAARSNSSGGASTVCFATGQQSFPTSLTIAPTDPTQLAGGYIPPDFWVMPNERIRVSNPLDNEAGTNLMFLLWFPDEIESPARKVMLPRGADGKAMRKKGRRRK